MSNESARAFCVRMMSDEDFRNQLLQVKTVDQVKSIIDAEYKFTKEEFGKIIGELVGHTLEAGELEKLITEFFSEIENGQEACKVVIDWVAQLA